MSDVTDQAAGSRRNFVLHIARAAGVAPFVMEFLDGKVAALPRAEETDHAILNAAIALEHHAIALYDLAIARKVLPAPLERYAVEFRGDHMGHRDTQIAIIGERGGQAVGPAAHSDVGALGDPTRAVQSALEVEVAAQRAYTALISQIRTKDYLLSAAFILVDEVRHMTVWRRVLGMRIY